MYYAYFNWLAAMFLHRRTLQGYAKDTVAMTQALEPRHTHPLNGIAGVFLRMRILRSHAKDQKPVDVAQTIRRVATSPSALYQIKRNGLHSGKSNNSK